MFNAEVIEHSRCTEHDIELITLEVTLPKSLVAQLNTHRKFSRNSASSRAIPIKRMIEAVEANPYIPDWHKNQRGMQPGERLPPFEHRLATQAWLRSLYDACETAQYMANLGCAKEDVNRLLEPWMWSTVLVTATDWGGFFAQRLDRGAQGGIRTAAAHMKCAMYASRPRLLKPGQAHLPFVTPAERSDLDLDTAMRLSVARCARVSYTKHKDDADTGKLLDLCKRLQESGHWSPFEHVARATSFTGPCRNFRGWTQYRAIVEGT